MIKTSQLQPHVRNFLEILGDVFSQNVDLFPKLLDPNPPTSSNCSNGWM